MADGRRDFLDKVRAALTTAGVPLVDDTVGTRAGAVVRAAVNGACVSWRTEDAAGRPDGPGAGRVAGSTSVMSPEFQTTLRLAAVLAHAGHQCDHLGDHVLVALR
ncbi:hypothetical protein AB0D08_35350 [Kitasatospora sp. NPDC048540]|uniref:hypothetical protein n=1 Tax=unclassified Kitasatospora TaxID=2633591 RepID=UPI000AD97726|nr:hypothetical protein [Kitasatospora sp. MBT63]